LRKTSLDNISRRLSYVLRHNPGSIGATLDKQGWTDVDLILSKLSTSMETLRAVVDTDNKGRYSLNEDGTKIRANQGHSIRVDLNLKPESVVPDKLFHGTTERARHSIKKEGLLPMGRHHVHLTDDLGTAKTVSMRRKSECCILVIDTKKMVQDGVLFYKSENGVWLVDRVDPTYITEVIMI